MDDLKGELTEAKQALAKSQEWASDAKVRRASNIVQNGKQVL